MLVTLEHGREHQRKWTEGKGHLMRERYMHEYHQQSPVISTLYTVKHASNIDPLS